MKDRGTERFLWLSVEVTVATKNIVVSWAYYADSGALDIAFSGLSLLF
ncbi:hypothetical protein [Pseudoalteromonas sp. MMG005]|nr:hypothetical protein [Pseudoalteromonas sp. MMG005]MBQ4845254.1 hypothetical protein [Pseudoalteromonas sp. MMG005]